MSSSKEDSSTSNDEDRTGDSDRTTQRSEVFVASGPYFAQYEHSVHETNSDRPSTSTNCNVVFSNIENLQNKLVNGKSSKVNFKKFLHFGSHHKQSQPESTTTTTTTSVGNLSKIKQLSSSTSEISAPRRGTSANNRSVQTLKKLLSTSQELFRSPKSSICILPNPCEESSSSSHHQLATLAISSRPRTSNDEYSDLETVPESSSVSSSNDHKSAFQQVSNNTQKHSKRPKPFTNTSKSLVSTSHNRSKSLCQSQFGPLDSDDESQQSATRQTAKSSEDEPIHMTLEEVKAMMASSASSQGPSKSPKSSDDINKSSPHLKKSKLKQAFQHLLHKTHSCITNPNVASTSKSDIQTPQPQVASQNLIDEGSNSSATSIVIETAGCSGQQHSQQASAVSPFGHRALPPVPQDKAMNQKKRAIVRQMKRLDSILSYKMKNMSFEEREKYLLYMESITRVKQCGWYWGPVSGEMAEKLLQNEPCGSFIVRDSSDEHYIFSLTFKLNGLIRHVRIEHDHGNFSFGPGRKYKNNTIVEFIEGAVEHSRNGQFLFFLHRVPIDGPDGVLRIQLLNPVSRFRSMQSLQHNCRFAILKLIRRDQIHLLDVPDMFKLYLDTPFYFSEELESLHDGPPPLSDEVRLIVHRKMVHFQQLCASFEDSSQNSQL